MVLNLILALGLLLIMSALFSAAETAYTSLSAIQLNSFKFKTDKASQRITLLMKNREHLLGTILVGNNIANISASALATIITLKVADQSVVAYSTIVLTLTILVFAEVTPKQFALVHNEEVARALSLFIFVLIYLLWPIAWFVLIFGRLINSLFGSTKRNDFALEGLFHMVSIGEEEGAVDPYEKSVVRNIFRLSDNTAMSISTHRKDVFSLNAKLSISDAIPSIVAKGFSRIPIFGSSEEDIVGVVMQQDIYKNYVEGFKEKLLEAIMLKPLFVPASMRLDELVDVFNSNTLNLAIALDEYGGLAGVVSREDLFEEILGELYDENEEAEIKTEHLADGSWRLQGDTPLYWLEEWLNQKIDSDKHVNTIGGHIIERMDRLAIEGEVVELEEGNFIIEKVDQNRLVSVKFYPKVNIK